MRLKSDGLIKCLYGPTVPVGFLTFLYFAHGTEADGIFQGKTFVLQNLDSELGL